MDDPTVPLYPGIETFGDPGPDRREAPCPHYGECGGCDLQHLDPDTQRRAKADIVIVDIEHPLMRPGREPLRNLINVAAERAVTDVFIDGRQVVANGDVLTLEYESSLIEMDAAQIRSIRKVPELDFQNRTLDQLAPMTFPVR